MRAKALAAFLAAHRKIALDSCVFIYHLEAHPRYGPLVEPVFNWMEGARGHAVTSTITLLEVLVQPYRLSDQDRVNRLYALLTTYPNLEWVPPSLEVADQAAQLRAELNLRTPDSLQAATALLCQATGLITNDPAFGRVKGLEILLLDKLLG